MYIFSIALNVFILQIIEDSTTLALLLDEFYDRGMILDFKTAPWDEIQVKKQLDLSFQACS